MKLKDSELQSILKEVETEIESLLKTEGDALKKAKEDEEGESAAPAPAEASAPAEGSPAEEASESPAEEAAEQSAPAEAPPAEASAPAPEMAAPPAEAAAPADPAAEAGPVDPEALKAEYSKLDPEALKAHYMAAKAALFELMGAATAGAPEAAAPAPAPAPEMSAPPPAMKAEVPASIKDVPATADATKQTKGGLHDVKPLGKSEQNAEIEDLRAQVDGLAKALELVIGQPMRKAVTSVAHLPKTDEQAPAKELSKSEVKEKIRTAMASGKLTKSQKDMLFSYSVGGTEFGAIKDLLEIK